MTAVVVTFVSPPSSPPEMVELTVEYVLAEEESGDELVVAAAVVGQLEGDSAVTRWFGGSSSV